MKYFTQMLLGMLLFSVQSHAHPHMFVNVQPYLKSIQREKVLIHNKWYFDEFTSEGLFMDYDQNQNQNQKLDKGEIKAIEKDFVSGLKKYNYFLKVKLNGKKVKPQIENFKIKIEKRKKKEKSINDIISGSKGKNKLTVNIVYYEFDIEISGKVKGNNELSLSYYDETVYSVLYPKEKIITRKELKVVFNKLTKKKWVLKYESSS